MTTNYLDAASTNVVGLSIEDVRYYVLQATPIEFSKPSDVSGSRDKDAPEGELLIAEMSIPVTR
jgi:hypothetical protein